MIKIVIFGASGFIGSRLYEHYKTYDECKVIRVSYLNKNNDEDTIHWDPYSMHVDNIESLEKSDVFINLAGANISKKRWNSEYKKSIYNSRLKSVQCINSIVGRLSNKPSLIMQASASGIYSNSIVDIKSEECNVLSIKDPSFLMRVLIDTELEAVKMTHIYNIQVVMLRLGYVLDPEYGILNKLIYLSNLGIKPKFGYGKDFISYIHINDVISIINYIIQNKALYGPINLTSPDPVTKQEFMRFILKATNKKKAFIPLPQFISRVAIGEVANYLYKSERVIPKRLIDHGYNFLFNIKSYL